MPGQSSRPRKWRDHPHRCLHPEAEPASYCESIHATARNTSARPWIPPGLTSLGRIRQGATADFLTRSTAWTPIKLPQKIRAATRAPATSSQSKQRAFLPFVQPHFIVCPAMNSLWNHAQVDLAHMSVIRLLSANFCSLCSWATCPWS